MSKPRLLDLFCGAGGAAMGYHRAGFEVVGVDIKPQPRYPFVFVQMEALSYLSRLLELKQQGLFGYERFDAIHASPPCQRYARIGAVHGRREEHPDLIGPTRQLLLATGLPYCIENVPDADLPNAVTLCGSAFGLGAVGSLDGVSRQLRRHRDFEVNFSVLTPECQHNGEPIGVYGRGGPQRATRNRGYMGGTRERKEAMGIDWMNRDELSQAIPPAYTEFIGKQLMRHIMAKRAAA